MPEEGSPEPSSAALLSELGRDIGFVDRHLIDTLCRRADLALAVEHVKRVAGGGEPISRLDVEDARLVALATYAAERGLNPNFVRALQYIVIAESCKAQMIQREGGDGTGYLQTIGDLSYEQLKGNLIQLTRASADVYDSSYTSHYPATQIYQEFERQIIEGEIEQVDPLQRHSALDIGCATGEATLHLARYFDKVHGVDLSEPMLVQARVRAANLGICEPVFTHVRGWQGSPDVGPYYSDKTRFLMGDVEDARTWKEFDDGCMDFVVMTLGTGGDLKNLRLVLNEIRRVLRPQGRFVLSFYNADALYAKLAMQPWTSSLAGVMDHGRGCIDVHFGNRIYSLFAQAYTADEIDDLLPGNLVMTNSYTCPTVAPIIPPSVLADPLVYERQKAMDITLAGTANQGAYLLVTGRKS